MTFRTVASRLWLFGWLTAWSLTIKRESIPPELLSLGSLLFGASGVIAGLLLFSRGFRLLRRKRWIEDTPVSKIRGAAIGPVKVFGRATGPYTLISPLAGVDCCYYQASVWNGRSRRNENEIESRAVETIYAPLFIEDETGRLMIDPSGAQLDLGYEYDEAISGTFMSESARRFLRRHGLSDVGDTSVTESVIKLGDTLLVVGTLKENPESKLPATSSAGRRVGYLSLEAADLQRREEMQAMGMPQDQFSKFAPVRVSDEFDLSPQAILGRGASGGPFVLSHENPRGMIEALAKQSSFDIWGGPALTLFSVGLLLRWFGLW